MNMNTVKLSDEQIGFVLFCINRLSSDDALSFACYYDLSAGQFYELKMDLLKVFQDF